MRQQPLTGVARGKASAQGPSRAAGGGGEDPRKALLLTDVARLPHPSGRESQADHDPHIRGQRRGRGRHSWASAARPRPRAQCQQGVWPHSASVSSSADPESGCTFVSLSRSASGGPALISWPLPWVLGLQPWEGPGHRQPAADTAVAPLDGLFQQHTVLLPPAPRAVLPGLPGAGSPVGLGHCLNTIPGAWPPGPGSTSRDAGPQLAHPGFVPGGLRLQNYESLKGLLGARSWLQESRSRQLGGLARTHPREGSVLRAPAGCTWGSGREV